MKNILILGLALGFYLNSNAQGCVAIRSNGNTCTMMDMHDGSAHQGGNWSFALNNRYFKSYKHFVGTKEQHHREDEGTEVINHFFSTEFGITKQFNNRFSVGMYVPIANNVRSSLYEHYGNNSSNPNARRKTQSFGLGDIRLAAYYWLLNPSKAAKGNVQLGLGLKLATGDYKYQDYFFRNDSTKILAPVDQSIQLGDGGTGITTELNAYYNIAKAFSVYANGYYLLNPREQNGVSTKRGGAPNTNDLIYGTDVMSVPDQYMIRAGGNFSVKDFMFSAGMRMECVPSEDLVGGSLGFRRPGYVLAVEPAVAYKIKKTQVYLSVPFAVERNRTQSFSDKGRTKTTGVHQQGDAAFADYSINFGVSFSLK